MVVSSLLEDDFGQWFNIGISVSCGRVNVVGYLNSKFWDGGILKQIYHFPPQQNTRMKKTQISEQYFNLVPHFKTLSHKLPKVNL